MQDETPNLQYRVEKSFLQTNKFVVLFLLWRACKGGSNWRSEKRATKLSNNDQIVSNSIGGEQPNPGAKKIGFSFSLMLFEDLSSHGTHGTHGTQIFEFFCF